MFACCPSLSVSPGGAISDRFLGDTPRGSRGDWSETLLTVVEITDSTDSIDSDGDESAS